MFAVGLMSGTSLDGVDAVLCEVSGTGKETKIQQLAFETYELPEEVCAKVQRCSRNQADLETICSLNFELGEIFAHAASSIIKKGGKEPEDIAFIASHGQTVYHIPFSKSGCRASTLQLGEPAVIACHTQVPVISNFRAMDMAAGGQGAPLVPYSEWVLYGEKEKTIALQNIGGIGNVTCLPAGGSLQDISAFDTGPGNMMIDEAMHIFTGRAYDHNGEFAAAGTLIPALQEELMNHPYFALTPPKSTGREMFGRAYTEKILQKYAQEKPEDLVRTLTWFTAWSIAQSYRDFLLPEHSVDEVILGGGGAWNQCLREMIQEQLPEIQVYIQEEKGYSSDAKEAIAFVILGNQTWHHQTSNVPAATGAEKDVILGSITYPY